MKFVSFNYVQIKCSDCNTTTNFNPGEYTEPIECPVCKEEKEKLDVIKQRRSRKSTKKIQSS